MKQTNFPILMYHSFTGSRSLYKKLDVFINEFRQQMFYLADLDYQTILHPEHAANTINPVMITFDDALFSVLQYAMPVMEEFGFKGVVFVPTAALTNSMPYDCGVEYNATDRILSVDELSVLINIGWSLQSHAHSHQHMNELTFDQIIEEYDNSIHTLKTFFGIVPEMIAYPFGKYNRFVIDFAVKAGFNYGFSVHQGLVSPKSDKMRLPRLEMSNEVDINTFKIMLDSGFKSNKDKCIGRMKNILFSSLYIKDVVQSVFPNKIN